MSHYFIGNDPSKYAVDVPAFGRVRYRDLYPGVDVEFFEHEGTLEYELLCEAGRESVCDQPLYPDEISDHSRVFDSVSSGAATIDGFVAKFDLAVSRLVFSTYIAGAGSLDVTAISGSSGIDVVGSANGGIPLTHAAFDTTYGAGTFGSEGFRIQLNGNGTAVHYAPYLGGTGPGSTVMLDTRVGESGEHVAR